MAGAELAEVPWQREQLRRLTGDLIAGPEPVRRLARLVFASPPAYRQATLDRPAAAGLPVQRLVRLHGGGV
jgi:hypothetical protein